MAPDAASPVRAAIDPACSAASDATRVAVPSMLPTISAVRVNGSVPGAEVSSRSSAISAPVESEVGEAVKLMRLRRHSNSTNGRM
jgi:hypothetical protein